MQDYDRIWGSRHRSNNHMYIACGFRRPTLYITTESTIRVAMASTSQVPLNRLLNRLDATLLSPSSTLPNTPAHRARIAANLEHARALHLTAEKSTATNRNPAQRQASLEELARQKEWIKRLETRLRELGEAGDDESEDESEGEDLLKAYAPAQEAVQSAGLDIGEPQAPRIPETTKQELRPRKPLQASDNRSAATTSAREELFAGRPNQQAQQEGIQKTETMMSHNRTEQEALTTGLLGLASALKQSSINFSSSLEAERDVMKRAEGGLDKSAQGMEAAGKKMGTLRRMSEGQGWWGRIKLYAFIFGLWVACFLLVFVGPKLRF